MIQKIFDPLSGVWLALLLAIGSYGIYILLTHDKMASKFYLYGKSLDTNKQKNNLFWKLYLLPKSYFIHFYISALLIFIATFITIILYYNLRYNSMQLQHIPFAIKDKLSMLQKVDTIESITSLCFTVILMTIQISRRLYESLFVSVYSTQSKINIIHYVFGHVFYLLAALNTILPILISDTHDKFAIDDLLDNLITSDRALLFVLFIYASTYQNKCHNILANLRKDKSGRVISQQHYVPSGSLFEYVSCPHFLLEIILYFFILVVQKFRFVNWNLTFLLVFTTQTINAIHEHKWYKRKYKEYPKIRKAIFPRLL